MATCMESDNRIFRVSLQSFEDLGYSNLAELYCAFILTFIENRYIIEVYHIEDGKSRLSEKPLTEIYDLKHLQNFRKSLGYPFKSIK